MRTDFDLVRLISPLSVDTFMAEYWEKKPFYLGREERDYYSDLLSMADVDYILSSTDLRYPGFRLVKDGVQLALKDYAYDISYGKSYFLDVADVDKVILEYQNGATIILQAFNKMWRPVSILCRNIEALLNYSADTNVYLTPKSSQGFKPHYDTHDVFILQISGFKHWRLYSNPIVLPLSSQKYDSTQYNIGEPLQEFTVKPGDLIYIPRGFVHEALTSDTHSLHITLGLPTHTWLDVLAETLSECKQDQRFRESLPAGFVNNPQLAKTLKNNFEENLKSFIGTMDFEAVIDRVIDRFISKRPPILDGHLVEVNDDIKIESHTLFSRRKYIIYRLKREGDVVSLLYHGKKISFPEYVEPSLQYITASSGSFTISDIEGSLDKEGLIVLVRRLIKEGFLSISN